MSCQKQENAIGSDFVGQRSPFETDFEDSTTLVAYTTLHDSVSTKNLSYYLLGDLNDPDIGTTKAAIFAQYALPYEQFDFGPSPKIDSIVLQLPFAGNFSFFGDTTAPQEISVYELQERLSSASDSMYYSNRSYSYSSSLIGKSVMPFRTMNDSVTLHFGTKTVVLGPHYRIRLDEYAPDLKSRFTDGQATPTGYFKTYSAFQDAFKGLAIIPSLETSPFPMGLGCLAYMYLGSANCAVVVYYNDSLHAEFPIYKNAVHTNKYTHQFNPGLSIQPYHSTVHADINYLQPATGLKTRITFPYLKDYVNNRKISITGAELTVTVKSGTYDALYTLPTSLRLLSSDSLGRNDFILDAFMGTDYFGGKIENGNTYRFNIIRQVQHWINDYQNNSTNSNFGLNLIVTADNPITGQRVILDTKQGTGNFKLKLTYSVIK